MKPNLLCPTMGHKVVDRQGYRKGKKVLDGVEYHIGGGGGTVHRYASLDAKLYYKELRSCLLRSHMKEHTKSSCR